MIFFSYFEDLKAGNVKNDNFISTLKSIWPLKPGHQSCMDIMYKNNVKENFSLTLKSTWLLRPDHEI